MGRRIFSSLLAMALIFSLPVFSLADGGGEVILKDSGSPEVSLMALRSIAADDGISLAAAEGNSGQFGYNIEPFGDYLYSDVYQLDWGNQYQYFYNFPAGDFSFSFNSDKRIDSVGLIKFDSSSVLQLEYPNSSSYQFKFSISEPSLYYLFVNFTTSDLPVSFVNLQGSSLIPVEGISSGYTYSSGVIPNTTRSIFETLTPSFGNQPAGKYLVNIYHWGDSYDVKFHISDSTESYYLPTSTNGGVTTLVYNHPGGDFTLDGSFTASNDETSVVDGNIYGSGFSGSGVDNGSYVGGEIEADGPLSWVFNITDIVAIPYEQAADSNFGFFAPIIGFINDHFASLKSFLADQFDKDEDAYTGATSPELSQDINSASSMIDQEQQFMDDINTQLTDQRSNVDPVTVLDGIDGSSNVFSSMLWVSSIVSSGIDGMGVFQFLIYVPMILGIVTLVIGRGASLAGRRPRPQPVNVRKGK